MLLRASVPVPCLWPAQTIVCAAPGPSLTAEDLDLTRGVPLLAINDAVHLAPWALVIYAADDKWWRWHGAKVATYPGMAYTLHPIVATRHPHVGVLRYSHAPGLSTDRSTLHTGGHGGYQAVNLAAHLVGPGGRIVLLGYDMQPAADGRQHYFGEHPDGSHVRYTKWLSEYPILLQACAQQRITLVNASRVTAITSVPRVELTTALHPVRHVA